jgi:hypothetical protein
MRRNTEKKDNGGAKVQVKAVEAKVKINEAKVEITIEAGQDEASPSVQNPAEVEPEEVEVEVNENIGAEVGARNPKGC